MNQVCLYPIAHALKLVGLAAVLFLLPTVSVSGNSEHPVYHFVLDGKDVSISFPDGFTPMIDSDKMYFRAPDDKYFEVARRTGSKWNWTVGGYWDDVQIGVAEETIKKDPNKFSERPLEFGQKEPLIVYPLIAKSWVDYMGNDHVRGPAGTQLNLENPPPKIPWAEDIDKLSHLNINNRVISTNRELFRYLAASMYDSIDELKALEGLVIDLRSVQLGPNNKAVTDQLFNMSRSKNIPLLGWSGKPVKGSMNFVMKDPKKGDAILVTYSYDPESKKGPYLAFSKVDKKTRAVTRLGWTNDPSALYSSLSYKPVELIPYNYLMYIPDRIPESIQLGPENKLQSALIQTQPCDGNLGTRVSP